MIDIDQLPIPDWGLHCPVCHAPLAGMKEYRCSACGRGFNIRYLLGMCRPIPDIELGCPGCGYLLTGLMDERCPECGARFSVRDLIGEQSSGVADVLEGDEGAVPLFVGDGGDPHDHQIRRREPRLKGRECPLPDFGLRCAQCGRPLAGATEEVCSGCGVPFDVFALVPVGELIDITACPGIMVPVDARAILYADDIPYMVDRIVLGHVYGVDVSGGYARVRIPRDFFFDAMHAFAVAARAVADSAASPWVCPMCREAVPAGFEICWNCGASHPASPVDE